MNLKLHTHLLRLPRGIHHTRLEIEWDLTRSMPTQGTQWALLMEFTLPSMTAGEYGGLR